MYKTEQEQFWSTEFGSEYIERNNSEKLLASNIHFFSEILKNTQDVSSIFEIGANIGMNLKAIRSIHPSTNIEAVEINKQACEQLRKITGIKVYQESVLNLELDKKYDFVFTKGVLIHINPDEIINIYEKIYNLSSNYICLSEYYNPTPVKIPYRGHNDKLFKRDFAGEMLDKYKDLKLINYGFAYKKDPNFPQDDITWFLLKKKGIQNEIL